MAKPWLPDSIDILGIKYSVEYMDRPSDVDLYKRKSLFGQVDYWTRSIRVYLPDGERASTETWHTIWHEVVHALAETLKIKGLTGEETEHEDDVHLLALGLVNVLFANGWLSDKIAEGMG